MDHSNFPTKDESEKEYLKSFVIHVLSKLKEERWNMDGVKETRTSPGVLKRYEEYSTTRTCNFLKHQADMVERKYTHGEEIYII